MDEKRPTHRPARPASSGGRPALVPKASEPVNELDTFERRLMSEVDAKINGLKLGLEQHVTSVIKREMAPYSAHLGQIPQILEALEKQNTDNANYRREREEKERIDAKVALIEENFYKRKQSQSNIDLAEANLLKAKTDTTVAHITVESNRTENGRRYKLALIGLCISIFSIMVTLGGIVAASHFRSIIK